MRKITATVSAFALVVSMTSANAAVTLISPVPSADPGQIELDGMQDQCDAFAALLSPTAPDDIFEGEVVLGAVTLLSGPTEVGTEDDRTILTELEPADDATFTPNDPHIEGDPFRNGGSVNMFAYQHSGGGYWSASKYDFEADFETVYRHAFSCNIYQYVYTPEISDVGHYEINPDAQGGEEDAILKECDAYNRRGQRLPLPGYWGNSPQGNCVYVPGETIPGGYLDPPILADTEAGEPIDLPQTDLLRAHESSGMGFETDDDIVRKVVVCISPANPSGGKKGIPGEWRQQNGYTGDKCTTAWYYGTAPYSPANYAGTNVLNLNTDSHNWVTIPAS